MSAILLSYKIVAAHHVGHNPTFFLVCDIFPHEEAMGVQCVLRPLIR
jgi:hypothetical protein